MPSQEGQDVYVLDKLSYKRQGFFVEIGAYDGKEFSNTTMMEFEYGWKGILSECDPMVIDKLKEYRRKCIIDTRAVWSKTGENIEFKCVENGKLSGIVERLVSHKSKVNCGKIVHVDTVTLDDLLDQYNAPNIVDYMSIDTEGSEFDILNAYSFSRKFRIVTIEHLNDKEKIEELMISKGYRPDRHFLNEQETAFVYQGM
jgi:FkbM family methyltransferase